MNELNSISLMKKIMTCKTQNHRFGKSEIPTWTFFFSFYLGPRVGVTGPRAYHGIAGDIACSLSTFNLRFVHPRE